MAKLSKLLLSCVCIGLISLLRLQQAHAEPAVVRIKQSPFAELAGKIRVVELGAKRVDGKILVLLPERELIDFADPGVKGTKLFNLTWIKNGNGHRYGQFAVAAEDLTIFSYSKCDQSGWLCKDVVVLDTKATAAAYDDYEGWEATVQPVSRIAGIFKDVEKGIELILLANGEVRTSDKLIKLNCEGRRSDSCEIALR